MLSVNNYNNYSPSFGHLEIAKDIRTSAALKKCSQETMKSIIQAGERLKTTEYLHGLIKKIGNKLVFRISVPKDLKFPNGSLFKKELQFINGHYENRAFKFADLKREGKTITLQGNIFLKLKKAYTKNGRTEYDIADFGTIKDNNGDKHGSLNIIRLVKKLLACEHLMKEFTGGRLIKQADKLAE